MDIAGGYFGLLKVQCIYQIKEHKTWWKCECCCGNIVAVKAEDIIRHKLEDCGCISDNYSNIIILQKSKVKQVALSDMQMGVDNKENKENEKAGVNKMENSVEVKGVVREVVNEMVNEADKELVTEAVNEVVEEAEPISKTDAMIGKRFGSLVVMEYAGIKSSLKTYKCLCDCGKEVIVAGTLLRRGKKCDCGCKTLERRAEGYKNRRTGKKEAKIKDKVLEHSVIEENNENIIFDIFNYIARSVNLQDINTEVNEDSCKLVITDKEVIKKLAAVEVISKMKETGVIDDATLNSWVKDLLK